MKKAIKNVDILTKNGLNLSMFLYIVCVGIGLFFLNEKAFD